MGILYRALDTRLKRTVAIKLLRPEAMSPERKQRFVQEAKAASALNHPHIITIHDIGEAPFEGVDRDFIVMEYVDGSSLDRILEDGVPSINSMMPFPNHSQTISRSARDESQTQTPRRDSERRAKSRQDVGAASDRNHRPGARDLLRPEIESDVLRPRRLDRRDLKLGHRLSGKDPTARFRDQLRPLARAAASAVGGEPRIRVHLGEKQGDQNVGQPIAQIVRDPRALPHVREAIELSPDRLRSHPDLVRGHRWMRKVELGTFAPRDEPEPVQRDPVHRLFGLIDLALPT